MRKALLVLLLACPAGATEIPGGDWHGADLAPANYDILRGTFTNVGNFTVAYGITVQAAPGERLAVYAATVTIAGHLNAGGSGMSGGAAGGFGLPGADGFSPAANGAGRGAAATYGGGGGGHADADLNALSGGRGQTAANGGAGGAEYGANAALGIPLSVSDAYLGSGGGGGGGGASDAGGADQSGGGGSGGGAIYIEAGYVIVSGTVSANGLPGGVGITLSDAGYAGGGGGGSGGDILIRSAGGLKLSNGRLSSSGGSGGAAIKSGGAPLSPYPGGGGSGGRVRLIYGNADFSGVRISTAGGAGGESNYGAGTPAVAGSSGTVSFGLFPSSPAAFAVTGVFKTSATYTWTGKAGAEWGGPVSYLPALTIKQFRLYASTTAVPFGSYYTGFNAADTASTLNETGLPPDSPISRMLTARTDLGDSAPSARLSFITGAAAPQGRGFPSAAADSVTFSWSSGTVAEDFNPAYTTYEVTRSTMPGFASANFTALTVGLSSAPANLRPNTTYYFRARALGLDASYTGYTLDFSTPTLALPPSSPSLDGVFVSSVAFSWDQGSNPEGTLFEAQLSENGFAAVKASSFTSSTAAVFTSLTPGSIYSLRVRAVNHSGRATDFTLALSTTAGSLGNLEAPGKPEPPNPRAAYTYDGTAVFRWAPPAGTVPIYEYLLDVGTVPGGNDFLAASTASASGPLSYAVGGLVSGKTYYARARARSAAGVLGEYSPPGSGVAAWAAQEQPAVAKPYNWPNPFDPRTGATSIGFSLPGPCMVTLTVYTLQGHRVREISAYEGAGGNKVWNWDGRNGAGRVVEPGGYLGTVKKACAGGGTQRFKMAVLY